MDNNMAKIRPCDLMACVTPPWECSFSAVNIKNAVKATAVVPFTRSVLSYLIEAELAAAASCSVVETIDYYKLNVAAFARMNGAENVDDDPQGERGVG